MTLTTSRDAAPAPATATTGRPWPRRSRLARVGPSVVVVGLLVAAAVTATMRGRSEPTAVVTGPSPDEVLAYADNPDLPVTYEDARVAGTLGDYDWGDRCDPDRRYNDTDTKLARLAIPSVYAPPCVPVWGGGKPWVSAGGTTFTDNGGATAPGVTADTIKVVFYIAAEQDIAKQLEQFGVIDGDSATLDGVQGLVEMSNSLYETYGRRVEVVPLRATGDGRSPSAARADAVRVVEMGAFASIGGPTQTSAYQHELARNHVLCIQCGYASTDDVLGEDAPYAWGYQATPDQLLGGILGLGMDMFGHSVAKFAGDPAMQDTPRRMGVVHYEQDPPIFGPLKKASLEQAAAQGASPQTVIQYILDPNTLNAQAQAIIGRLKREGITTVVFLGDPLMPRLLTQQATKQDYHPEWLFTGTAFTDTTAVARLYDQQQMAHAFGASSTPARTVPELSEAWSLYTWWFGKEPTASKTMLFWGPVVQQLFLGIHMAGPHLSAETFAGGLFNYPPSGGTDLAGRDALSLVLDGYLAGDTTPAISFGSQGEDGRIDFVAVDDFTSAWWDPNAVGPDENGKEGRGMWQYVAFGLRIPLAKPALPGAVTEDIFFQTKLSGVGGAIYATARSAGVEDMEIASPLLQTTPPLDVVPAYPSWPESPAAQGGASP